MVRLDNSSKGLLIRAAMNDYPYVLRGANTRSPEDVIRIRMRTADLQDPIWTNDILTSAYVLYTPGDDPLFLKGFTIPHSAVIGNFPQEGELRVEPEARRELDRYTCVFPNRSITTPTRFLGDHSQLFGINGGFLRDYGVCLDQVAGVNFVQVVPLKTECVNSRHGNRPFIRQVRIKGIRKGNYNQGGFAADVPIRATEKEYFLRTKLAS